MISAVTVFGERLLNAVLPRATAEADDYCHWETQCKFCVTMPPGPQTAHKTRKRLCCTSQDGYYCDPWSAYNKCMVRSQCGT
jgi:hypothetical protein